MPDEEDLAFEELEEPDDLAEADLDELEDDDVIEEDDDDVADVLVDDEVETDVGVEDDVADVLVEEPVAAVAAVAEEDDDEEEEEEDLDPDDVEAGLDVILKDRLVVVEDEDEEEEETPDPEERVEGAARALTKRPGEFTCQSCFLVKHPSQLADPDRMLCRDCV